MGEGLITVIITTTRKTEWEGTEAMERSSETIATITM